MNENFQHHAYNKCYPNSAVVFKLYKSNYIMLFLGNFNIKFQNLQADFYMPIKNFKISSIEKVVIALLLLLATYIYIGFFFPDPYASYRFGSRYIAALLFLIRIGFPALVAGGFLIYTRYKAGKISMQNIFLIFCSSIVSLLILYPIGLIAYNQHSGFAEKKARYHPYLQLMPPRIQPETYDTNTINIVCLGGSTTEYTAYDKRGWPDRVEALLNVESPKKNIRVYNLGMQWYTTLHSLINYETNVRHFKPDVIIVMHAINDLLHNADHSYFSHASYREDYGHFYGPVNRMVENKGFIREVTQYIKIWYYKPRTEITLDIFPGLVPFKRNINTLIDIAQLDSTRVILMTEPYIYKEQNSQKELQSLHMVNVESYGSTSYWSYTTALNGMREYNNAIKRIAKERTVYLIDLEQKIPKNLDYFWDDVHYCEKTFDLIAEFISTEIKRQGVLTDSIHGKKLL